MHSLMLVISSIPIHTIHCLGGGRSNLHIIRQIPVSASNQGLHTYLMSACRNVGNIVVLHCRVLQRAVRWILNQRVRILLFLKIPLCCSELLLRLDVDIQGVICMQSRARYIGSAALPNCSLLQTDGLISHR